MIFAVLLVIAPYSINNAFTYKTANKLNFWSPKFKVVSLKFLLLCLLISPVKGFSQVGLTFTIASLTGGNTLTCNKPSLTFSVIPNTLNLILCTVTSPITGNSNGNPFVINAPGIYTVTVLDLLLFNVAAQTLNITQDITPPVITSSATTVNCATISQTNPDTLTSAVSGPTLNFAFNWTADPGIISATMASSVLISSTGSYSCLVTNTTNGCSSQGVFDVSCLIGINENNINSPLVKVYPNPFNEKLNLNFLNFNPSTKNKLIVNDINGRKIYEYPVTSGTNEIAPVFLPNGFYFIELHEDEKVIYRNKFIKY